MLCSQSKGEKTMAKKKYLLGMLALTLVFSLAVVACNPDPALNGTWTETNGDITETYIFNSGSYEYKILYQGVLDYGEKGTYTTSGGIVTITVTQVTWNGTTWEPLTPPETKSYLYSIKNGKLVLQEIELYTK
jgi:hypothetical protein